MITIEVILIQKKWMTSLAVVICVCFLMLTYAIPAYAEDSVSNQNSAADYMRQGIRAAYHNMHLQYEAYYDEEGNLQKQAAGHVAIEQEWDGDILVSRTYLDDNAQPMNRIDGYSKVVWEENAKGTRYVAFYDLNGNRINDTGVNLSKDVKASCDGWSEWKTPTRNMENCIINVGDFTMTERQTGDEYTIQITVEFKDVSATNGKTFVFRSVGAVDDSFDYWADRNPWNNSFIYLEDIPENKEYTFTQTIVVTDAMLHSWKCNMGLRCDYWKSGMFRIKDLVIQKGNMVDKWLPGL